MKKIILLPLLVLAALGTKAQDSTSLYQQFNTCDSILDIAGTYNHFPSGWSAYSVIGAEDWRCEAGYGVNNTACFHINGYASMAANQDENWLITPKLDLSSYAGSIFLNFAASYYYPGDSLHIMVSNNYVAGYNPDSSIYSWTELQHFGVMLYDTFYYVTGTYDEFQSDLTPFKSSPVYVAFKYTSSTSAASVWDLDSVTTGTTSFGPIPGEGTGFQNLTKQMLPVSVFGMSTSSEVKVAFDVPQGQYDLAIYDLPGRKVYNRSISSQGGNQTTLLTDANLTNGMYILKIGDGTAYGVTKFTVQ